MMSRIKCLDQVCRSPIPQKIVVRRLFWDWNDPSEVVENEMRCIGEGLQRGCWYLNPMFKVYSPEPVPTFLGVVRKRQREWFRMLSRQFGSSNWRQLLNVTKNVRQRRTGFTGILIIRGRVIDPYTQRQLEAQAGSHPESDLVSSRRPET